MFRHLLLGVAVLGMVAASTETASAQLFRGNNPKQAPPPVIFPPSPQIPILNNGSLQTTANPNTGLPGQLPFAFIAALPQDCRLNLNGVQVWEPRLDSMCFQLMNQQQNQNNIGGLNVGQIQGLNLGLNLGGINGLNLGLNLGGLVAGYGAMRPAPMANYGYPGYYSTASDASRSFMGSNYTGYSTRTPAYSYSGGYNFNAGNPTTGNFFNSLSTDNTNGWNNLGTFGGDTSTFNAFKTVKLDANDDKEKNDQEKNDPARNDREKARKDEIVDKQR
jgi:hypothetical protein